MARGVLTVAALLSVTAGVGLAAAAIIRNPTLEGVAGGVFGGFTLALVIMGIAAWSAMALMRTPKPVDAAAGESGEEHGDQERAASQGPRMQHPIGVAHAKRRGSRHRTCASCAPMPNILGRLKDELEAKSVDLGRSERALD